MYISAQRSAKKTDKESIWVISRSGYRTLVVIILWKCNILRCMPANSWPMGWYISPTCFSVLKIILATILDCKIFKLLPLHERWIPWPWNYWNRLVICFCSWLVLAAIFAASFKFKFSTSATILVICSMVD